MRVARPDWGLSFWLPLATIAAASFEGVPEIKEPVAAHDHAQLGSANTV